MDQSIMQGDIVTVNTGDQYGVYDKIKEYFDSIQREIDKHDKNLLSENPNLLQHPCFERNKTNLIPIEWIREGMKGRDSDDYFHVLLYKEYIAAAVIERRDISNYIQFTFFNRLEKILEELKINNRNP